MVFNCLHSEILLLLFQNEQGYLSESGNALVERRRKQICNEVFLAVTQRKYMQKFIELSRWRQAQQRINCKAFIKSCHTWPNLLSNSYQLAPVSSSLRTAIVTDPITLHLHAVSQSYIVMVTYAESSNACHTFNHSNSGVRYSAKNIRFRCSQLFFLVFWNLDALNFSFRILA
jgi:hypothetical protein